MAIQVRCDCGRKLKLRDNLAGKQIRCPDCEVVLEVPGAEEVGDGDMDEFEVERPRRSASGSRGRRAPAKKSGGKGLVIGLIAGGALLLLLCGAVVALLLNSKTDKVAQNPAPVQQPVTPEVPLSQQPVPAIPAINPVPVNAQPPVNNPAVAGQNVWVVVSNFRQTPPEPGRIAFGNSYAVDFRVAIGQWDPSKKYVLYVRNPSPSGFIEHYLEVDLPTGNSGTVNFTPGPGFGAGGGRLQAAIAYRTGVRNEWEKVSAEITVGGQPTAATPPPTVQELAGAAAQGKLVAIANAKLERQGAAQVLTIDLALQGQPDGLFYFLVGKTTSGDGVEIDITNDLRQAQPGVKKNVGGRLIGPSLNGPLTVQIEKRKVPFRSRLQKEDAEVVSNSIQTP